MGLNWDRAFILLCIVISSAACVTASDTTSPKPQSDSKPNVQEPRADSSPVPGLAQCPEKESGMPLAKAPAIYSVTQSINPNGQITFTVKGNGIDNEAVLEIYTSSGERAGGDIIFEKISDTVQIATTKPIKDVGAGKYIIKLKNLGGQYSNDEKVTIQEAKVSAPKVAVPKMASPKEPTPVPKSSEQCSGNLSKQSKVLYLGGGEAEEVFKRYLSRDSEANKHIPRDMKIKFYEVNGKGNLSLVMVGLGDMEQMFVESQEDFFVKIIKLLKGRIAAPASLNEASGEKADYFQCTGLPLEHEAMKSKK